MSVLLAVHGDSLAHRAYHGLPKTIRGAGGRPANALVGFGNFLSVLWDAERPDAVVVAWDTLEVATYRHTLLPAYQSGSFTVSRAASRLRPSRRPGGSRALHLLRRAKRYCPLPFSRHSAHDGGEPAAATPTMPDRTSRATDVNFLIA